MGKDDLRRDELKPLDPEQQAKLLEEESRGLKRCGRHPVEVFWDGAEDGCPCCQAVSEWLALTEDMEP